MGPKNSDKIAMRFFGATSVRAWIMGLMGLMSVSTWAQKIYFPKNQEFGAPLTDEDWKALREKPQTPKSTQRQPASVGSVATSQKKTIPPRTRSSTPVIQEEAQDQTPKAPVPPSPEQEALGRVPAGLIDTGDGIRTLNRYSAVRLAPLFFYSSLNAKNLDAGGSTAGTSNLNYGVEGEWQQELGSGLSTHIGLRMHRVSLRTGTEIREQSYPQNIFGVKAGLGYAFASWGSLDLQGALSEELFMRTASANLLSIDKIYIPQFKSTLHLDLFTLYPFEIGLSSTGILLLSKTTTNHQVEMGKGYRVALVVEQGSVVESLRWVGSFYWEHKFQNTNLLSQVRRDLGLELGLIWGDAP